MEKKSSTFCYYPLNHVNFDLDGTIRTCHRSEEMANLSKGDKLDWNSDAWRELRKDLGNEKRSEKCKSCWSLEDSGAFSYRKLSHLTHSFKDATENYDPISGKMLTPPSDIEIRFTNECNLRCRMCSPGYSSKWERFVRDNEKTFQNNKPGFERLLHDGELMEENSYLLHINNCIDQWKDNLKRIMIAGGEPLMQKEHLNMLNRLSENSKDIELSYSTNLSVISCEGTNLLDLWKNFKKVTLRVSIDGNPKINSFVRISSNHSKIEDNIKNIQANLDTDYQIYGVFTASIYNTNKIIEAIEYITSLGLLFYSSQVQTPDIVSSKNYPPEIKKELSNRVQEYLENLEENLNPFFEKHSFWDSDRRKQQIDLVEKSLTSSIDFMNSEDKSISFKAFVDYDKAISGKDKNILDLYPAWQKYL